MRRKKRGADRTRAKAWEYQVGDAPNTVTAYERTDRGRAIEVRWWASELKRFRRKSLGFVIRDAAGMIDSDLQAKAVRLTRHLYDQLLAGEEPTLPADGDTDAEDPVVGDEGGSFADEDSSPLTLEQGFALATAVPTGMYVVESQHLTEVRRAVRDLGWAIGNDENGRARTWNALRFADVRDIWVRLATRYKETGQGGPVWTDRCIVFFLQINEWLEVEGLIERAVSVRRTWRQQMRREWEQLTANTIESKDLRHTEEEIALIFAALSNEDVDPRIALSIELGAEARLGQVRRMMRSDVTLDPVGAYGLGRVVVRGSGRKLGVKRDLTPEERGAIDRALKGYLRDLEAAYQAGLREDYPMFPQGKIAYDVPPSRWPKKAAPGERPSRRARVTVGNEPLGKRNLTKMFHELEVVAGVTPMPGRGWYGIRRKASDVYEDYESDERILNDQTGHSSSETRRKMYQEREREEIRARSAQTRRRVRALAFGRTPDDASTLGEERPGTEGAPTPDKGSGELPDTPTYPNSYPTQKFRGAGREKALQRSRCRAIT